MYISKNELIRRLVSITDKNRSEFATKTVETLGDFIPIPLTRDFIP